MGTQLKTLLRVMDRLNAGDTKIEVPYLRNRTEVGRIAATLEAFRCGLIDSLEVFVEDRGPGIAPEQQSRIFESMFTTKMGGTGLGLAIAKSIVESHGGTITMIPATPHGAMFQVLLPSLAAEAEARRDLLNSAG